MISQIVVRIKHNSCWLHQQTHSDVEPHNHCVIVRIIPAIQFKWKIDASVDVTPPTNNKIVYERLSSIVKTKELLTHFIINSASDSFSFSESFVA